ncbi:hypothetical protein ACP70R_023047 [Stipagrostis hirtigluma subsp. patula]
MAPRSTPSAALRSIRRELQRRRPKPLAPKKPAAKKPSAPPSGGSREPGLPRRRPPRDGASSITSRSRGSTAPTPLLRPLPPRASPRSSAVASLATLPPPPSRSGASSAGSACPAAAAAHLRPGTEVLVRTRTGTLPTGQVLVLWLGAVVVSATEGGYEVVYNGEWPRGNPFATVHVPRDHVKLPKRSPAPTQSLQEVPPSAASSCASATATVAVAAAPKKEMKPAPRPTTAGKSIRLVRKLWPEMELPGRSILTGY